MCHIKPSGSHGQKEKSKSQNLIQMSFSKLCLEMVRDLSHCYKIPLETQKAILSKEKCSKTLGQPKRSPPKFSSRHINYKSYAIRRCTSREHLLTQKISLCFFNIKSYMELHPTTNRQIQLQTSDLVRIKQKLQGPSK